MWQFIKRHRRKLFIISLLTGGGYAAFRFLQGKLARMLNDQDKMLMEWKKQLYYEHNRDTSLRTSTDIFAQVVLNINRRFQCENILTRLSTISDSTEKRELWEQLRIECFARLFTFAYSSSFVLALTELVVSALSGRLYSQSQLQQLSIREQHTTTAGGISSTSKSSHAESTQDHSSLLSRDIQLACLDVIRYTTDAGMNNLIDDVRKATQSILSRIPLQQMLDINDIIWYCSEIRHQIEKKRHQSVNNHYPLLKYVRSISLPSRSTQPATTTTSAYSLSNVITTASSLITQRTHSPSSVFNVQQQFEIECIEMIESETFQRVLIQIIDQSFSNIYDEFAREMAKTSPVTVNSLENNLNDSTIIHEIQLPFAKIVPISNNIYTKLSSHHEQLMLHFQSLACRPELHEYTKYAYDLFSNESLQSANRTAYSFLPLASSASASYLQSSLSSFLQSLMSP
ncbi:unnamed protein product [Rotaria sordida]|uniref:Peroxisomal biogenesis factor 3 n=2 Tax=Rotaria sordida TaxID=392033 RepID=A0A813V3L6_9BILA|nr:unnamed protein product [Rotaria sordida]CAF0839329.1 unnamed protein product [Rotaria sordida]CAF0859720.1 unnamed protein product [Rotaria sordida]CAF0866530.1 unnamed protein product [Rotaria sordida]CAF3755623.1 unnamed protein product [Rotaria sordida]